MIEKVCDNCGGAGFFGDSPTPPACEKCNGKGYRLEPYQQPFTQSNKLIHQQIFWQIQERRERVGF